MIHCALFKRSCYQGHRCIRLSQAASAPITRSNTSSSSSSMAGTSTHSVKMDTIVQLCKKRGFIFPSAEVYNSMAGFFDYGPLGVEMKNNIKQQWWADMVRQRQVSDCDCD